MVALYRYLHHLTCISDIDLILRPELGDGLGSQRCGLRIPARCVSVISAGSMAPPYHSLSLLLCKGLKSLLIQMHPGLFCVPFQARPL